ncbi:MAG: acyl-CoA dehydrogenase family protein [Bacteroidetes bacterium]|nr:acyl-CoA dehydrogenase family protein [Bacteroidota bacterium]
MSYFKLPEEILKGGSFLVEDTKSDEVFIPEEFNEEQLGIYDMVKDFCLKEIHGLGILKVAQMDASKHMDEILAIFDKASELGLMSVAIPEEYEGLGLDFNTGLLYSEAISMAFSFATTIGAQTSIGSLPIVYYGTEEQKKKYLPGIASGEIKAAYALTEPSSGSDANSGKTNATLNKAKTHYILNGQKMWITNGGFADVFIVFAKIDDDKNLSAFIVEKAFGGIELGAEEKKLGIKASSTVQVFFNNCEVPVENLLSERGEGFKIALNILNSGRAKLAAGGVGGAKFALDQAIKYANQREQFGTPISSFGAMKYKIGQGVAWAFATESAVYRTGYNIDRKYDALREEGATDSEAKVKSLREFAIECAIIKVQGSELLDYATDEALQIHGGMGYSMETGIEMGYRDARITRIYEGTNEINRMLSVAELTKRAMQTKEINLMGEGKKIPAHLIGELIPFRSGKKLKEETRIVENIKKAFLLISGAAGRSLGKKLVDEQEIVMNFADILAEAFICESALLRVKKLAKNKDLDQKNLDIKKAAMRLYLYEALDRVRKAGYDAINSYASGAEKIVMRRLLMLLTPPYEINPKSLRRKVAEACIEADGYCL